MRPWAQRTRQRAVLVLACSAEFMVVLDASVVNVALPSIRTDLDTDPLGLQWVVSSYALVFAGFLLLGGRLADIYGQRRVFLVGITLFSGASAIGGMANTPAVLITARAIQALGAAMLAPTSLTILTTTFAEGSARVRALALWTALASAGGAAGNLLGGVLTDYLSWRATLLGNVPLGAIALLLAPRVLPPDRRGRPRDRIDVLGAVSATTGIMAITLVVTGTERHGWQPVTWIATAIGVGSLGLFVLNESRAPAPLIPLRLFRSYRITLGNLTMLLAGTCLMPMWYFLSLYMQRTLGYDPLTTGFAFLPHTMLTVLVGASLAPRLMRSLAPRTLIATGATVTAAGLYWQSHAGEHDTYFTALLGPAVLIALGGGVLNTPLTTVVTSGVAESDAGAASGLANTTKQIGGGLGLAVLVAVSSGNHSSVAASATMVAGFSVAFEIMASLMLAVAALALTLPALAEHRRSESAHLRTPRS